MRPGRVFGKLRYKRIYKKICSYILGNPLVTVKKGRVTKFCLCVFRSLKDAQFSCDCKNAWIGNYYALFYSSFVNESLPANLECEACGRMTTAVLMHFPRTLDIPRDPHCWPISHNRSRNLKQFTDSYCSKWLTD